MSKVRALKFGNGSVLPIDFVEVTVSGTTPSISIDDNTIYTCSSTLTSLTLTDTSDKDFSVIFTSGTTPTTLTVPNTLHMPDDFEVESNVRYEINVKKNYGLVAGWDVS